MSAASSRDFGVVIDVGTHSGVDGACTNGGNTLTTAAAGIVTEGNPYAGGTLVVLEHAVPDGHAEQPVGGERGVDLGGDHAEVLADEWRTA